MWLNQTRLNASLICCISHGTLKLWSAKRKLTRMLVEIMKYFKIKEFTCKCCGKIPAEAQKKVTTLVDNLLDPAREVLGYPIYVNSGYRCPKNNERVGGVRNSQHLLGEAADLHCKDNKALIEVIKQVGDFDQLIIYRTFVHVSYKSFERNRRMIIDNTTGTTYHLKDYDIYEK